MLGRLYLLLGLLLPAGDTGANSPVTHLQPKTLAILIRSLALDKKAEDPVILDIAKLSNMANYFVIVHGNSDPHVRAIAEHVQDELKAKKVRALHVEGVREGKWVLLDYGSVILHVFYYQTREFYSLESLWGHAKRIPD